MQHNASVVWLVDGAVRDGAAQCATLASCTRRFSQPIARAVDANNAGGAMPPRAAAALEMRKSKSALRLSTLLRPLHPQKAARVEAKARTLIYQEVANGSRRGAGTRPHKHTTYTTYKR